MQHGPSVEAFFKFNALWKPHVRIMGGDLWDFRPLRKGCSEDERRQSLRTDLNAGKAFFNRLKPHVFLRGNHDERLWELAENGQGVAADYASEGVSEIKAMIDHHKCTMLPYHKREGIYKLGCLKILHGFYPGHTAARRHAFTYQSCMFGHTHADDQASIEGLEDRTGYAVACLCRLDMDYNSRHPQTLRQSHGFAYGVVNTKTGRFNLWKAKEIDGEWRVPSDVVSL